MNARDTACFPESGGAASQKCRRGSVLLIILITLLFAAFALVVFMDKASNDLLVEHRDASARRLRMEAYSALEVTLAVLEEFRQVGNGLRNPAEGWADPLGFAGYTPAEDRKVTIAFEDESGKISLPRTNATVLINLFKHWQLQEQDAEALADALMGWMKLEHIYVSGLNPTYEQSVIPFEEPRRSIRSFEELAAIDKVRELFFGEDKRPNDLWRRFADSISLLDFQRPNLNGAKPDTLAAVALFDQTQQQTVGDYLKGTGSYQTQGPGFFRSPQDAQQIAGPSGDLGSFATTISALRILVAVQEGTTVFRMSVVIAPRQNGATTVRTTATAGRAQASATTARNAGQPQNQANAAQGNANAPTNPQTPNRAGGTATAAAGNLQYPFTLLEIRENDEIPPAPPPPSDPQP